MSKLIQITDSKGNSYNCVRASAKEQLELASILSKHVVGYGVKKEDLEELLESNDFWIGHLYGQISEQGLSYVEKIRSLAGPQLIKHGENKPVTIEDFDGNTNEYLYVLAELIKVNIKDFLSWLLDAHERDQQKAQVNKNQMSAQI